MKLAVLLVLLCGCAAAWAVTPEERAALEIISGIPYGPDGAAFDCNGTAEIVAITGANVSIKQVRAVTNRADVVALAQKQNAENPDTIKAAAEAAAEAARQSPLRLAVATNLPALKVQAATIRDVATKELLTKLLGYIEATETRLGATEAKEKASK